jgi:6-phosphogluconolactonase (cycloisomerase 2 family)
MKPNKQSHDLPNTQKRKTLGTLGALALSPLIGCGGGDGSSSSSSNSVNYVYTQTNILINEIVRFQINSQGTISYLDRVATGGIGSNGYSPEPEKNTTSGSTPSPRSGPDPLISQSSIYVSQADSLLFTVNAGDPYAQDPTAANPKINTSSITVFSISKSGALTKKAMTPVQGIFPNSLVYNNGYLYVSYYGWYTNRTLESFKVQDDGSLISVDKYTAPQQPTPSSSSIYYINNYNVSPSNVLINPSKTALLMISDNSNQIYSFTLNSSGTLGTPTISAPTITPTPQVNPPTPENNTLAYSSSLFSFAGVFIKTSAGESLLTTSLNHNSLDYFNFSGGNVVLGSPTEVFAGYADACWITSNPAQTFAYMAHATSNAGAITSYQIASNGQITQSSNGKPAASISGAAGEMWVDPTGTYLSLLDLQFAKVYNFSIQANGKLTQAGVASIALNNEVIYPEGLAGFVGSA